MSQFARSSVPSAKIKPLSLRNHWAACEASGPALDGSTAHAEETKMGAVSRVCVLLCTRVVRAWRTRVSVRCVLCTVWCSASICAVVWRRATWWLVCVAVVRSGGRSMAWRSAVWRDVLCCAMPCCDAIMLCNAARCALLCCDV